MAEDSDLEKSEPPTPRRLEQARERGQVPRSRELGTFGVLMAGVGGLKMAADGIGESMREIMRLGLTFDRIAATDPAQMFIRLESFSKDALITFLPLMIAILVIEIMAPLLLSGWNFSTEAMMPDFGKLNPLKGLGRLFSWQSVAELFKALMKTSILGGFALWVMWLDRNEILTLMHQPLFVAVTDMWATLTFTMMVLVGGMLVVVAFDVPYQIWEFYRNLRMTKEEVRQEMKETEGDPMIKGRIRQLMREAARKRMMGQVPKADVIITNPTHFAVALQYKEGEMKAPRVVAKGSQLVAERIIELGRGSSVPVLRAPPLARALWRYAELEEEIPHRLFQAVAEVLAYIYQLNHYQKHGGLYPKQPETLPVPEDLDFNPQAAG